MMMVVARVCLNVDRVVGGCFSGWRHAGRDMQ